MLQLNLYNKISTSIETMSPLKKVYIQNVFSYTKCDVRFVANAHSHIHIQIDVQALNNITNETISKSCSHKNNAMT